MLEFEDEFFTEGGADLDGGRVDWRGWSDSWNGAAIEEWWVTIG